MTLLEKVITEWPKAGPFRQKAAYDALMASTIDDWVSLSQAARRLSCHPATLIKRGWARIKRFQAATGRGGRAKWQDVLHMMDHPEKAK